MTDDEAKLCEMLRTALNAVSTGLDGFPDDPSQASEWRILAGVAYGITHEVCTDPATDDERAWYRVAAATLALMASAAAEVRDPAVASEWFAARAALPPMPSVSGQPTTG